MTTNIMSHTELFDILYENFKKCARGIEETAENFMDFLVIAMEQAELLAKTTLIHGLEKKELVKDVLERFLNESKQELKNLSDTLKAFADKTIDIIVAAAKGQLHFNEAVRLQKNACIVLCTKKSVHVDTTKFVPKDVAEVEKLTEDIFNEVKNSITNKTFCLNNIVVLVTIVMQVIEKSSLLTGLEKKEVAMNVVRQLIDVIPMSDSDREGVHIIVETVVSKVIDVIIMAANGDINIGEIVTKVKGFFGNCCGKKPTA